MKYVKIFEILAIAAAALMAFASTASATVLTAPPGTVYTKRIHAVNEGGHVILHNPITTVECESTMEGTIELHGSGNTVEGAIGHLTFTSCTNSKHVTVVTGGFLVLHFVSGTSGTLTSRGASITIQDTISGINCWYKTGAGTDIGTFTSAPSATGHATLDINSALIPRTDHSAFCGSTGTWTGSYKVVTPTGLTVDP